MTSNPNALATGRAPVLEEGDLPALAREAAYERFGPIPWAERYARPFPLPTAARVGPWEALWHRRVLSNALGNTCG